MIVGLLIAGLCIGVLSSLVGVGGGVVMIPVFRLFVGMSATATAATSIFSIIFTSMTGTVARIRMKMCSPVLGMCIGFGGALMSPLGARLNAYAPGWLTIILVALIILYTAVNMLNTARKMPKSNQANKGEVTIADDNPTEFPHVPPKRCAIGFLIGLVCGFLSGFLGIGAGFIVVPLSIRFMGLSMKQASGTSLIAIMILSIPAAVTYALAGSVDYLAAVCIIGGALPGVFLGSKIVRRVDDRKLRFIFSGILVAGAIALIANEIILWQ